MTDDLVKRLRDHLGLPSAYTCFHAADRIEDLEAALKFYATGKNYEQIWHEKRQMWISNIATDHGERARQLLGEKTDDSNNSA
jgi:hypothetical protein